MIGCHFLVRIFYKFASGILSADKQLTSLLNDAFVFVVIFPQICLSPGRKKEDLVISPADEKFLQKTNDMKIHEIPTRENGTTDPDHSSSSKFDESWPSTERAMVSTPEAEINISEMSKTPSSTGSDVLLHPLPDSTLARSVL